jgi:hypothetical protein
MEQEQIPKIIDEATIEMRRQITVLNYLKSDKENKQKEGLFKYLEIEDVTPRE